MNDSLSLAPSLAAGLLLGAFFFGGLWWTVRKGVSSTRPAYWVFGSLLLRTGITLAGFYWVSDGHWKRLLGCLVGFILARLVITRLTRLSKKPVRPAQETVHAP